MGPIIIDLEGTKLTPFEKELILHPLVGGIIFFSRNFESAEQIVSLSSEIKQLKSDCLLCVDQEGGRVQRFKKGFTLLPALNKIGALLKVGMDISEAKKISALLGELMALEVRSVGVDLSFAPVLDLGKGISEIVQDRAFHSDPRLVSELAIAYVEGMAKAGMQATGKHFPGHGSVVPDSHLTLPEDLRDLSEIKQDMIPFAALIKKNIAALMPAHIVFPKIDSLPVGFSPYWLKTILREELGFTGAIVSDDLTMEGAKIIGDYKERTEQAIKAGCDIVLICNNRAGVIETLENVHISADKESEFRRKALLAKEQTPSYAQLKQSAFWQEAQDVLKQLQLLPEVQSI